MRAEDIKVGMWVRDPGGDVCQTSRQSEIVRGWHVEYPDGRLHTWPSEQLEPWTPRVGELVRVDTIDAVDKGGRRGKVGRVREVKYGIAFLEDGGAGQLSPMAGCYHVEPWPQVGEWVSAVRPTFHDGPFRVVSISVLAVGDPWVEVANANGSRLTARAGLFAPCLPPAPPTTHLRADGVEVPLVRELSAGVEVATEAVRKQVASWSSNIGANSTCLKCGGLAYLGLQEARCLAPKCERVELEPTRVVEMWRDADGEISPVFFLRAERVWEAVGRGRNAQHPIREEAIRLWREAVSK